jgi:RNase adapter protein RapZ
VIHIVSLGLLHDPAARPEFTVMVDVRLRLHDPHVDPAFRELTGKDQAVRDRVLNTPGARKLIHAMGHMVLAMKAEGKPLVFGIGCSGGRHRSVVLGDELFTLLCNLGETVSVAHLDIDKPVITRG